MNIVEKEYREQHGLFETTPVSNEQLFYYLNSLPISNEGQKIYRKGIEIIETVVNVKGFEVVYLRPIDVKDYDKFEFDFDNDVIVVGGEEEVVEEVALFDPSEYEDEEEVVEAEEVEEHEEVVEAEEVKEEKVNNNAEMISIDEYLAANFIKDSNGAYIPIDKIPKQKRDCDLITTSVIEKAKHFSSELVKFKESLDDIFSSLEKEYPEYTEFKRSYSVKSYDGTIKIVKQKDGNYRFYEDGKLLPLSLN